MPVHGPKHVGSHKDSNKLGKIGFSHSMKDNIVMKDAAEAGSLARAGKAGSNMSKPPSGGGNELMNQSGKPLGGLG